MRMGHCSGLSPFAGYSTLLNPMTNENGRTTKQGEHSRAGDYRNKAAACTNRHVAAAAAASVAPPAAAEEPAPEELAAEEPAPASSV